MTLHTFHLARLPRFAAVRWLLRAPRARGLRRVEVLAGMRLGAPALSLQRMQVHRLAVFAEWEDEAALERFLREHPFGRRLAAGWHVRLEFLRRWGSVAEFSHLPEHAGRTDPDAPVVAVTLARMRLPELPRFIRWGRPVERQVRDHPQTTLALAGMRPPRSVSTFSVWTSARAMTGMVFGHGAGGGDGAGSGDGSGSGDAPERRDAADPEARRHVAAMGERDRRDFHHEFTTLRFRPLSEHGSWDGRSDYVRGGA